MLGYSSDGGESGSRPIISADAGQTARARGRAGVRERRGARSIPEHVAAGGVAASISLANHSFLPIYPLLSLLCQCVNISHSCITDPKVST